MDDFLLGIAPQPSAKVNMATTGLYDSVVVGVFATTPNLDAQSFRHTLLSALTSLGWDPDDPRLGVAVRFIGTQPTVLRMSSLVQDIAFSKSAAYIFHAPLSTEYYQQLDYEFKHLTHLISFHGLNEPVNLTVRSMAKSLYIGVLDVVCDW